MMRAIYLSLIAAVVLAGCGSDAEPQAAELRVAWGGGTSSAEAMKYRVLLVEPADGIADHALITNPAKRAEVFEYRHDAFYGGYYLDIYGSHCRGGNCRSGIDSETRSLCTKEIYAEGGDLVTATITQASSRSCSIRLERSTVSQD
jgi:hypothetical protein